MYNVCSNCNHPGHRAVSCKNPIISIGIIAFCRINATSPEMMEGVETEKSHKYEYLLIRRRNSIGFMDFVRGKYSVYQSNYIVNLLSQMTLDERESLLSKDFHELWESIWRNGAQKNGQYHHEEFIAKDKYELLKVGIVAQPGNVYYTLQSLINDSYHVSQWKEQEWGFPKGKRNYNERDLDCGLREFHEETGIPQEYLRQVENVSPFEEIFTGSNYKSYKHKYYLMEMPTKYIDSCKNDSYDKFEVSKIEWKTYDDCIKSIRPYNLEKIKLIEKIDHCLNSMIIVHS